MSDDEAPEVIRSRIHLPAWARFGGFFGFALETLDAHIWYGEHLAPLSLALALTGRAVLGAICGAIVGWLIGAAAIAIEPFLKVRPGKRKHPPAWLLGLALGIAVGTYNVTTSPYKIAHDKTVAACERISYDIGSGQVELDNRHSPQAIGWANDALSLVPSCGSPSAIADEAQAHLMIAVANYQTKLSYKADAKIAQRLAEKCLARFPAPDDPVRYRCQGIVNGAIATQTQQYCDDSLHLSNAADDSIAHLDYGLARDESTQAMQNAQKCKNPYAYAYRGIAMLKHGIADYLDGRKAVGDKDIANGKELLGRCLDELDPDSPQKDLRRNCAVQLTAAKPLTGS